MGPMTSRVGFPEAVLLVEKALERPDQRSQLEPSWRRRSAFGDAAPRGGLPPGALTSGVVAGDRRSPTKVAGSGP
jgi:hypothetical protein